MSDESSDSEEELIASADIKGVDQVSSFNNQTLCLSSKQIELSIIRIDLLTIFLKTYKSFLF